jgi:hypothetical protein
MNNNNNNKICYEDTKQTKRKFKIIQATGVIWPDKKPFSLGS